VSLDRRLFQLLQHRAGTWRLLDTALIACARYGSIAEVGLMLLAGLRYGANGRAAVLRCLAAVAALYGLLEMIGRWADRARPFASQPDARPLLRHSARRSFPSRHVASAVAMAAIVQPWARTIGSLMAILAVALGVARVRAGLHYPSDVLVGAVLGSIIGRLLRQKPISS
jgi:undecaprenyl-diphosphatase